ncbi:MAG: TetR/AcrR family transcriptional regulator [Silicimonas sp.]|nr:TetR/AcrR family transcriptional regulator [Silicimonas sp.]
MPPADPAPAKRDKALAARRRKILEAAVMCFLENGYHQTGVRDIAAKAGISLGNLYNHFSGKHDVLVEIATLELEELAPFIRRLRRPGPALKALDRFVASYAKYLSAPENIILSIEITSEAIRKDDLAALFMENRKALVDALADLLSRGVQSGELVLRSDPQESAELVLELIEGRAYHSVLGQVPMLRLLPGLKVFLRAALGVFR